MMSSKRCYICGKPSGYENTSNEIVSLFRFPNTSQPSRKEWIKFTNLTEKENHDTWIGKLRLCSKHFAKDCMKLGDGRYVLSKNAVPTLLPQVPTENEVPTSWKNFCLLCRGVEFGEKLSCHRFPAESELKKKWADFCSRSSHEIRNFDVLCRRHFTDDDYAFRQRNKYKAMLRSDAVPSIHTEYSSLPKRRKNFRCILCDSFGTDVYDYHRFPTDLDLKEQWLKICNLEEIDVTDRHACSRLYVCSSHFTEADYEINEHHPKLKANAVPTLQLGPPGTDAPAIAEEAAKTSLLNELPDETCTISFCSENLSRYLSIEMNDADSDAQKVLYDENLSMGETCEENADEEMFANNANIECVSMDISTFEECNREIITVENGATPTRSESNHRRSFIGDFSGPDMDSPRKARQFLDIARTTMTKKSTKILNQRRQMRRLENRIATLKDVVTELKSKSLIEDSAAATIMAHIKALIRMAQPK